MNKLPVFSLKKITDVSEADLRLHPVWAAYYEPDDIETLVALGYDRTECSQTLEAVGYSDLYVFPLPIFARHASFKYLYQTVSAVTKGGHSLLGYRTGSALCLLAGGRCFSFNRNLADLSKDQATVLANALGDANIFPITLAYAASAAIETFDLYR
ncbi:hypothetical protein [Burkholderia cepacia]|uniref:hypothetical protein n=1 Tax=Burkholderia cepacia TaxID=292 RepID=UPI002FE40AC5